MHGLSSKAGQHTARRSSAWIDGPPPVDARWGGPYTAYMATPIGDIL